MDSYMALRSAYELLHEENAQLQEDMEFLREQLMNCLELLHWGEVTQVREILEQLLGISGD